MDGQNKHTPRTDLRLKRLAYFERLEASPGRNEENVKGEELRKSMSRDPRVRPKSAVVEHRVTVASKSRPSSAIGKQSITSSHTKKAPGIGKSPRISNRDVGKSSRNASYDTINLSGYKSSRKEDEVPQAGGIKVNSWLDKPTNRTNDKRQSASQSSRETGTFLENYLTQKLDRSASKQDQQTNSRINPPNNTFSSFLEAQYEEDYSALALSSDIKNPGSHGFFMEDSGWSQNFPRKAEHEPMHYSTQRQKSKDNILRESLEEVVKEEAKRKGHSEPDRDHVDKKVSAMFDTLDPSNLETILGKERYERLIKNFEESEDIVDEVSNATGPGWLKDSSEDCELDTFRSRKNHDDNVIDTLSTHRSDPASGNVKNIQIEISEPYQDQMHGDTRTNQQPSVFDLIMQGETPSTHPAEASLISLLQSGKSDINNLPIVPDPVSDSIQLETHRNRQSYEVTNGFSVQRNTSRQQASHNFEPRRKSIDKAKVAYSVDEIYKEADRLSGVGSQFRKSYAEKPLGNKREQNNMRDQIGSVRAGRQHSENIGQGGNINVKESTQTLKDYDKRLTKSGVFAEKDPPVSSEFSNTKPNESTSNLYKDGEMLQHRGMEMRDQQRTKGPADLLAKASLDTASEFTKPMFRDTFGTVKEANATHNADLLGSRQLASHLSREDHVEGIKQHVEIRKREQAEMSGQLPTNPALERYFSSVENLHIHKNGPGSVISSEGFEPVPEPEIFDETPGRGLVLSGKSAPKHESRPKSAKSTMQSKGPPRPVSGRRSKDFAPSSSRSNKSQPSLKTKGSVRSSSQTKNKDVYMADDEKTEVTFNPSEFEDAEAASPERKLNGRSHNSYKGTVFSSEQSRLLRDVLKEHDETNGKRSNDWDDLDDDDLLTRVTSMVDGADGALTQRIKKLNIDFDTLRAGRKGESIIEDRRLNSSRSLKGGNSKGAKSTDETDNVTTGHSLNDDLGTCVETEIGTDLGTDFVNVFFQKKQELKDKQTIKENEIRKSVISHAFPVVNDSDDDFTVVTALKSVRDKPEESAQQGAREPFVKQKYSNVPKHNGVNRVMGQSPSDDEDSNSDFNMFRKSRQRKVSKAEEEDELFNEEFEVGRSEAVDDEAENTSRDAKSFFEEIDAKYKSSIKENKFEENSQQMVKACPECGEVNKVYVTWCVECGGVLSEVKPVPFLPKKSHTPREAAERVNRPEPNRISSSPAEESFKIKLENSFNGPKRGGFKRSVSNGRSSEDKESTGTGNIRESDDFEYEEMESPVRALPDPLKQALSLDLRTSTDSSAVASSSASGILGMQAAAGGKTPEYLKGSKKSARQKPGVHNELVRMSEKIDFVYNEAESPKKSFPRALQRELSLDISLDSDSAAVNRINDAAEEVLNRDKLDELPEREDDLPPAVRVDVAAEADLDYVPIDDDDGEEEEIAAEYNGVGPSGDAAESFKEFISHVRKDPRFNVTGKARPSSAAPQLSKSKSRPQSAIVARSRPLSASVKSKVRSSLEASQYERKWATSSQAWSSMTKSGDLRASSSLGLKSTTRPGSAKGGRPSSAVNRSMGPGGDAGKGRGRGRPQSATSKSRLIESGDFGIIGRSAEIDEDTLNTGRTALLTVTSATKSKGKAPRKRNVFDTYTRYIAMKDNPVEFQSPRIAIGEYSAWLCLPDELWLMIVEYLNHKELSRLALTCSQLNRITMDDSLWKSIVLRKSHAVNDDWLINIGKREPVSLSLVQCHGDHVTPHGMRELFRQCSESLQELKFTGCNRGQLTGDNILLHVASRCRNITHLDASWTNVNDNGVTAISEACDRLEIINFSGCQTLTDEAISGLLVKHGIYLREVELFGCFNLTAKTATALANHCKGLVNLNIGQMWKLTDTSIAQLSGSLGLIETLNVSGCKQMKDTGVHRIVQNCPKLKTLALANCPTITDTSMGEVATYSSQVRSLDVSGCKNVGNNGIRMLAMACQQLEFLDVSSTTCTHKAITSLANYCNRRLEVVKVNFCKNITVASLVKLATHCRRLKKLYLYGVNGIRSVEEIKCAKLDLWIEQ